jgi:hypothetical protein
MGTITRGVANGITTSGVVLKAIVNNASMDNITAYPSGIPADGITLISSQTASSSASISFTSGITSTYKAYKFVFVNIHPATDGTYFEFNMSTDGGANYNVTKTTTAFYAYHKENDAETGLAYDGSQDLAQSTAFQHLTYNQSNANDASASGYLHLFNPSSTTFVKHFLNVSNTDTNDYSIQLHHAGYGNTTSAVNAIQFKMSSGNIDDGIIKLYGVKKS